MPKHSNDNSKAVVILEEDRAGNVRPVLAPLPESDRGEHEDTHCRDCGTLLVRPASIFVRQCIWCSAEQEERIAGRRTSVELLLGRRRAA